LATQLSFGGPHKAGGARILFLRKVAPVSDAAFFFVVFPSGASFDNEGEGMWTTILTTSF
jgi:hypothetical protein